MCWHSPVGYLLPTARPWLCLPGASRRGKAESSWLAQTVWSLALQPRLPRRCWVGLGWQPLCCCFSEVISEINRRTLSRGEGDLGCAQGDHRSQCWVCLLEVRAGASAGQSWVPVDLCECGLSDQLLLGDLAGAASWGLPWTGFS